MTIKLKLKWTQNRFEKDVYTALCGGYELIVCRHIHLMPTQWKVWSRPALIEHATSEGCDADTAKRMAENLMRTRAQNILKSLKEG